MPVENPEPARPAAVPGEVRVTWIGHATFLVQIGGLTLLTDPIFSARATPVSWMGPRRLVPPALTLEDLPEVHAVLLSHSHYDHLDRPSVVGLHQRFGDAVEWITPLGYRSWFGKLGIQRVSELDWWDRRRMPHPDGGELAVSACPAQHWSRRGLRTNQRLWASFALDAPDGRRVYFGGDSGYFDGYAEIGARHGAFDVVLLPIGAYEPRWFMRNSHMNPEDAVRAYGDLGGRGLFVGMHWGTFRLTDEHPLEPPERTRAAWEAAGHPEADLRLPGVGGTVRLPGVADAAPGRAVAPAAPRSPVPGEPGA